MLSPLLATGFALAALCAASSSSSTPKRTIPVGKDGTIHSSVKTHVDGAMAGWGKMLKQRQNPTNVDNQMTGTSYTIDIALGTPPQPVTVILDTGSANLWVNPTCETSGQQNYCEKFAQFDYTRSSTIGDTGYTDILSYGKGNVTVEYVTDVVSIGSADITDQVFGVGFESYDIPIGILGLSPPTSDSETQYSFVLDSMVSQGLIDSRAFSLDLRGVDNPDGAVIFGGVDTGKYAGILEKCPILDPLDTPSGADRYWITMTTLGMTLPGGDSGLIGDGEVPVFLDSGGTVTRLPTTLFQNIGAVFPGAQFDPDSGFFVVDCDSGKEGGSVDFGFGEKVISVAFDDFIWQVPNSDGSCVLGVLPDDDEPVLGDSFLRAAYVVYDQDNRNLHLAQAANCGSKLVAISSGTDAVPSETGDCTASASVGVQTSSLTAKNSAAPTITKAPGGLSSDIAPGPQGTATGTSVTSKLCLTCKPTSTQGAGASATGNAASGAGAAPAMAAGALAVAAWLL